MFVQQRSNLGVVIIACTIAAVLLFASTSGTFAAWTSAIITNSSNSVATAGAVILSETQGAANCRSDSVAANASTCTTINSYGGTTVPLSPGVSRTVDLTFQNIGTISGSRFVLTPGTCTSSAPLSNPNPTNLCTQAGELTVQVQCSPGGTFVAGAAWADIRYGPALPPTSSLTHTASANDLAPSASWTCRITVALSSNASIASQNVTVTQSLTWSLHQ